MPSAVLNMFQRLFRQWDSLHPYNGGQAMLLAGPPDVPRTAAAWHQTLHDLDLGRVRLRGDRVIHEAQFPDTDPHDLLEHAPASPGVHLPGAHLTAALNRPYNAREDKPFRAFLVEEAGNHWLGVAYQHWVADSASVRALMREWYLRLYAPELARRRPAALAPQQQVVHEALCVLEDAVGGVLGSVRAVSRMKRVRRLDVPATAPLDVAFMRLPTPPDLLPRLQAAARRLGVTVNDLFVAAAGWSAVQTVPLKRTASRRNLAVGTIVDLRPRATPTDAADAFGLQLGFFRTAYTPRQARDAGSLLLATTGQMRLLKQHRHDRSGLLTLATGLAAGKLFDGPELVEFYRKRVPLAAGVSNVNLDRTSWPGAWPGTWPAEAATDRGGRVLDYLRASPTGPVMPVVFTPTTFAGRLNVGMTWRRAVLDEPAAGRTGRIFIETLEYLCQ